MNIFNSVALKKPQTSTFDMTHDVKFSARMGELTPILVQEVLPGDRWTIGADSLIRMAPLIAPVMHRMDVTIHYFYVPNRILWDSWGDFIMNNVQLEAPYVTVVGETITAAQRRFLDYMGIPCPEGLFDDFQVSALPFAAYQAVYNEYYRDQNLVSPVDYTVPSGAVSNAQRDALFTMRLRAYEHDYFTASLPFAQKGADVDLPLGQVQLKSEYLDGTLPDNRYGNFRYYGEDGLWAGSNDGFDQPRFADDGLGPGGLPSGAITDNDPANELKPSAYDPNGTLEVGSTTIKTLRTAFRLQEWLERMATGGSRYIEGLLSHFFVRSSDKRLQRPEYITGVKTPIVISEVLNTTGEDGGLPQGNMAGHAVSVGQGHTGSYYAEEHGFIIGVMSVLPKTAYMQGLPRFYSRRNPLDYAWPSFALIGEQEVLNKEIFIGATETVRQNVFGYVPRYAEYKYAPSRVCGDYRFSLDYWHLGRKFATLPVLNQEFIECNPDDNTRIFAVEDGTDELLCHVLHKLKANRRLPYFGTPTI